MLSEQGREMTFDDDKNLGDGRINTDDDRKDPVLREVIDLNKQYKNTKYSKSSPMRVGPGYTYSVSYKGENEQWYTNYVYRRRGKYRAYETLDRLIADPDNKINVPWYAEFEMIRFLLIFSLTVALVVAWVVVYTQLEGDKQSLQYLTGILGILIGWLVAKAPKAPSAED
jgi:hypothetical protein